MSIFRRLFSRKSNRADRATGKYSGSRAKKNSSLDNLKMDLGIKPKNQAYHRDLEERNRKSKQALKEHLERRKRDRRRARKNDDTKPTEEVTNVTETTETNTNTTTLDPATDTALTNVENISNQTLNNTDNISNYFDNTATSVNTAAAQEQNQASALTTSVGEAEDDAISYMTSGTGSNILTSAQGLLGGDDEDEDDPFNRRKTLIGA